MNIFKNLFAKKQLLQSIAVYKYPDRMIFTTNHRIRHSYSIRSAKVTILNTDASDPEIGETIIKHLALSKDNIRMPNDELYKATAEAYKKNTGLRSVKAEMKDALCVLVSRKDNEIIFSPTTNGGTSGSKKGFQGHSTDESLVITNTNDFDLIGQTLSLIIKKCRIL